MLSQKSGSIRLTLSSSEMNSFVSVRCRARKRKQETGACGQCKGGEVLRGSEICEIDLQDFAAILVCAFVFLLWKFPFWV